MSRLLAAVVGSLLVAPALLAQDQVVIIPGGGANGTTQILNFQVPGPPPAPPRDTPQAAKPGTATLRGRVVAGDSGRPMSKAQVRITSTGPPAAGQPLENRLATTDSNGRYEFKDLRAGRYNLMVSKPGGYLNAQYGQQRPSGPGKPLEILDGQTIEKVDFSLPRGGVIAGRILDEFGEPVTDVQVSAVRSQFAGGQRRLVPGGRTATTNDVGEFRVFALAPGDYYVSATLRNTNPPVDTTDRTGYAPTYYPGTADLAGAQRVTVAMNQTISDLSLSLLPIQTARVTGTAVDSRGQPMRGVVQAVVRSDIAPFASPGQIRPDGSFTINGLAPGDYTLQVQGQGAPGQPAEAEYASADISVAGADITGVQLTAVKPSTITGRLVIGSGDGRALRPSALRVGTAPMPTGGINFGPFPQPGPVNDDWTFQAKARSGLMRINTQGLQPPWTIKAVRYRGSDVTDSGLDVKANEEITDVEIELTNRITDVSGLVTNSRGEPVKDYWVVLFARDSDKRRPPSRYIRVIRSDQEGRFKVTGLPAAEYLALAVDSVDAGEASDPEFLDRIQTLATRFTLGEGETKTLDLKLNSLP